MAVSNERASQPSDEKVPDVADFAKETDFGGFAEATDVDKHRTQDMRAAVVALYDAFAHGDRAAFETLITDDFRFTSPYDDAIDRAEFFERCWPNHERMAELALLRIGLDGAGAFVTYEVEFRDGHRAENTEWLEFREGKVESVDVYFGPAHASSRERRVAHDDEERDPAVELAKLQPLVGTWTITGTNAPREGTAPDPASLAVEGEETYEAMRGDFFVLGHWTHRFRDGGEHTGISVLGHEPERGSIMCENFDNLGYAREYRVAVDGSSWTLTGAHERATYTFSGEAFTVEWESSTDGREWRPLCQLEGRKRNER